MLSFDNNEEAEEFVASVEKVGGAFYMGEGEEGDPKVLAVPCYPRSMYAKPTQVCECSPEVLRNKDKLGRGSKYGWWVHMACGKPPKQWIEGDWWYAALGKNLLDPSEQRLEWRGTSSGKRMLWDGTTHCIRDGLTGQRVTWDRETKSWVYEDGRVENPVEQIREARRKAGLL